MKKILFSFLTLSLAGCTTMLSERVECPKAAIIAEFSKTIDFTQGIPIRTEMDSFIPYCTAKGNNQTLMDLRLRLTSIRSLSNFNPPVTLKSSYFIAVVDDAGHVLSRTDHPLVVVFEEKQTTKVNFEYLQETVPAAKNVSVYAGFNLDKTQLDFLAKERLKRAQAQESHLK
jgi:hypothetical protein